MASRPVKLKLVPRSTVKAKSMTRLVGHVIGGDGIIAEQSNGNTTISVTGLDVGVDVQAYDADLQAIANNSSNGLLARTGPGTAAARTITGTNSEIAVAFGDGVSGNPTISLPTPLAFTGKTVVGGFYSDVLGLEVTPVPDSTNPGVTVTQSSPSTGSAVGPLIFNQVYVENSYGITPVVGEVFLDPDDPLASAQARAFEVKMRVGGANLQGYQIAQTVQMIHSLGNSSIPGGDFIGLATMAFSNKAATGGGGGLYSINANTFAVSGAAHNHIVALNSEIGIFTGATVSYRSGLRLQSWGDQFGSVSDAAITVCRTDSGQVHFKNFVTFSEFGLGSAGVDTTGDMFNTMAAFTVANIFNLPTVTVTGNILDFPHTKLTGAGVLTLNTTSAAAPTPVANTILHVVGSNNAELQIDSTGTGGDSSIQIRHARGTAGTPSALQSGDLIGGVGYAGYGATGYSSGRAAVLGYTRENWTDAAQGANLEFQTTPTGSTTRAVAMRLGAGSTATDATLTVMRGAPVVPTPVSISVLHLVGQGSAQVTIDSFVSDATITSRRANTSSAAPSALQSGDIIGGMAMAGYGATGYSASGRAAVLGLAHQNWTDANQGANLDFRTTSDGSTTLTSRAVLYQGLVMAGGAADQGAGTITATGMWSPTVAGGVSASSTLTLESTSGAGTTDAIIFKTASQVERARITTDGLFNIGAPFAPNAGVNLTINGNTGVLPAPSFSGTQLQIGGADSSPVRVLIDSFSGATIGNNPSWLSRRARGSRSAPSAVQSGDVIGAFVFMGYGATGYVTNDPAAIYSAATENWSDTASGTKFVFSTIPNTTIAAVSAMTLHASGGLSLSTAADPGLGSIDITGSVKINGTTAIDALAWSTYTPTVTAQVGTITTASATGRYKQIGKTVIAQVDVTITTAGTGSSSLQATLPVTAASNNYAGSAYEYQNTGKSGACVIASALSTSLMNARDATGTTFIANTNKVVMTITYEAA
jgi:hypothetical protein